MGIRFYCPNGHKLNVKSFQAGKAGICPHCGVTMQIPLKSTRSSSRPWTSRRRAALEKAEAATSSEMGGPGLPPVPSAMGTLPSAPTAASAPLPDPLAEEGDFVWYVRPATGGQFGPAKSEIVRSWLAQGRVSSDTLVWREGWRQWQEAGNVFPQLASNQTIPELEEMLSDDPRVASPLHAPKPKKITGSPAVIIGAVVVVVVAFLAVLLLIWLNS